jgi:hypothetical protein
MLNLLTGFILGIFAIVLVALHLAASSKKAHKPPQNECNVASLGDPSVEQIDAQLLNSVLRGIAAHKLFEIPTNTRH